MGVGGQHHNPAALSLGSRHCTHCVGGWVGPRGSLDRCGKSHPQLGFDPLTVQPVASCYTDYAIPALVFSSWPNYLLFTTVVLYEQSGYQAICGLLAYCITNINSTAQKVFILSSE